MNTKDMGKQKVTRVRKVNCISYIVHVYFLYFEIYTNIKRNVPTCLLITFKQVVKISVWRTSCYIFRERDRTSQGVR